MRTVDVCRQTFKNIVKRSMVRSIARKTTSGRARDSGRDRICQDAVTVSHCDIRTVKPQADLTEPSLFDPMFDPKGQKLVSIAPARRIWQAQFRMGKFPSSLTCLTALFPCLLLYTSHICMFVGTLPRITSVGSPYRIRTQSLMISGLDASIRRIA